MTETTYHGKPCPKGHGTLRRVNNRNCVTCQRESDRRWQARRYDSLTGSEYNLLLLKQRRTAALARMAKRNERSEA